MNELSEQLDRNGKGTEMTDEELIELLRRMSPRLDMLDCENVLTAADRIEQLAVINEALQKALKDQSSVSDRLAERLHKTEGLLAKAVEALKSLHHAVCGETGFASAVRNHSGKAYPWEPLDIADAQTRAVLTELEGK